MLSRIEGLPEQLEDGWQNAASFEPDVDASSVRQIVVLGIGGSAIAGDILSMLAEREGRKPAVVVRGYDLPGTIDRESLVIACSHSGKTEETLTAFDQAVERGLPLVAVTTGGELAERARKRGLPVLRYSYDGEPRSALGHQLTGLIRIAERVGVLDEAEGLLREATSVMRSLREHLGAASPVAANPAKQLAMRLEGKLPFIVGEGALVQAAHRWKTQLNENSKCWAFYDELPELDHNAVVGFGLPERITGSMHVVFLRSSATSERMARRIDVTGSELELAGVGHESIDVEGEGAMAQVLAGGFFGDFVSYYLALVYGVDPAPVPPIVRLKEQLAR
jgi:glucose/mannose-6-phosphate isomerase